MPDPAGDRLSPADAQALDALVDAGFDPARVPESLRPRAEAIASLLGPVAEAPTGRGPADRADAVFAAIAAIAALHSPHAPGEPPTLTPASEDAVDSWVMAAGAAVAGASRPRAAVLSAWRDAVVTLPPSVEADFDASRGTRIERTLAAVRAAGEHEAIPLRRRSPAGGFRLRDLASVAAFLVLASAVLMPTIGAVRAEARQAACMGHLDRAAHGLGLYASDFRDQLPMAAAGFGGSWMRVGEDPARSNSANLFTLARTRHATLEDLSCPGNARAPTALIDPSARDWRTLEEISFSYQILPGASRPRAMLPSGSVVMTDRSPVVLRVARGEPIVPEASSPNHAGEGQHVMRLDGSVGWARSPVLEGGDNLWLPRAIELRIHQVRTTIGLVSGDELPDSPEDAFVGP